MQSIHSGNTCFWDDYLDGYAGLLNIGLEFSRPPVRIYNKQVETISSGIDAPLTPLGYPKLLAALAILLYRYTGQEDIVIGVLPSQFFHKRLVGEASYFAPLPLRVSVRGDFSLTSLCDQIEDAVALIDQHCPTCFEEYAVLAQWDTGGSFSRLFQVLALPSEWLALPSNAIAEQMQQELVPFLARSDLAFSFSQTAAGFDLACEYDAELWGKKHLRRMLNRLPQWLSDIADRPRSSIHECSFIEQDEYHLLISKWGRGLIRLEPHQDLNALIDAQIASHPNTVAINGEMSLSYHDLGVRINRLAGALKREGVSAEVTVGLLINRNSAFPIGFLAILKAGGVCVPLDPAVPDERINFILEETACRLIVTQVGTPLPGDLNVPVVFVDEHVTSAPVDQGEDPPGFYPAGPDNLAYIIYTSGTTNRPKGVMIERGALADLLVAQRDYFGLGQATSMLWFASAGFDASVFEALLPLVSGGALSIAPEQARTDMHALSEHLRHHAVNIATLPPSLLAHIDPDHCPTLTQAISIGEDCPEAVALKWSEQRDFYNGYGPTEATIVSTVARDIQFTGKLPIGQPIAHRAVYVLDERLLPVPIGVVGELYVGGSALARGYLKRAGLTAENFLPDPFSSTAGARMYKTGDLGRFRPDGQLEYIGRRDHQIQLRGVRIEPGEIEARLRDYPGIEDAAVVVQGGHSDQRLVAFVTGKGKRQTVPSELRDYLRQLLPPPMIPSEYRVLERLPLTHNGKIDRRELSIKASKSCNAPIEFKEHLSTEEAQVAEIWSEVFGGIKVGLNDDFFELGGHSLLVGKVMARVRDCFQVELEPRTLFDAPTLATFTAELLKQQALNHDDLNNIATLIASVERMTEEEARQALEQRKGL